MMTVLIDSAVLGVPVTSTMRQGPLTSSSQKIDTVRFLVLLR